MSREECLVISIREQLRSHVPYDKGLALRATLKDIADTTYTPRHSDGDIVRFLSDNEISVDVIHAQSTNHPYYLCVFTSMTQHIYGDNFRQAIDDCFDISIKRGLNDI